MENDFALYYYIGKTRVTYDELFHAIQKKKKKTQPPFKINLKGVLFQINEALFFYSCTVKETEKKKQYCIWKTSRVIHFNGENSRDVWISNIEQLRKELDDGFTNGYYYNSEEKAYFKVYDKMHTFLNSNCSLITNIFIDDKDIKYEFERVYQKRENFQINKGMSLSPIIEFYQNFQLKHDNSFQLYNHDKRMKLLSSISDFYLSKSSPLYPKTIIFSLTGPSGIGKSISLLSLWANSNSNISTAYFNYKTLIRNSDRNSELLKILCYESIKIYNNYKQYTTNYN